MQQTPQYFTVYARPYWRKSPDGVLYSNVFEARKPPTNYQHHLLGTEHHWAENDAPSIYKGRQLNEYENIRKILDLFQEMAR